MISAKRRIDMIRGESLFSQGLPLYLNRSVESYELSEHQHDFFEISYVAEGSGTHILSGITLPVKQGGSLFTASRHVSCLQTSRHN